ncbi:MAG: hypothetical protein IJ086_08455 [Clostridium sp.]|nr:hypothetical protein [Clostridium sp.]
MVKYFIEKKIEKEVEQNGKKALILTGAILTGIGAYASYKAIKKYMTNLKQDDNQSEHYLIDSEYEIYNYEDNEKNELEEKVNEFNSRRINSDNSNHVSQEDMANYVNSIEDTKDEVEINKGDYKEDEYEKYEYYEEDLKDK